MLPQRSETPSPFIDPNPSVLRHGLFANQRYAADEYEQDEGPLFPSSQPESRARLNDSYRPLLSANNRGIAQSPLVAQRNLTRTMSTLPQSQFSTIEEHQVQQSTAPAQPQGKQNISDLIMKALTLSQNITDVVSSLTNAVKNAIQPLVDTTSGIVGQLDMIKAAVGDLSVTTASGGGDSVRDTRASWTLADLPSQRTERLLDGLLDSLKPINELKVALQDVKDLPQALLTVATFAESVRLLKKKVAVEEASLTPPPTQARPESLAPLQPTPNAMAPMASSSTLGWLSPTLTPTTPAAAAASAEMIAAIKIFHEDVAYLRLTGVGDHTAAIRKLGEIATATQTGVDTATARVSDLSKRIDSLQTTVTGSSTGETGTSSQESITPSNLPAPKNTLKRKAAPRKPKGEPAAPAPVDTPQPNEPGHDVFGPVVPITEAPAAKRKRAPSTKAPAAPKKRATTAAPRKAPAARSPTTSTAPKKPMARSVTAARVPASYTRPVVVLDSDDSLESRSPDTPDGSPPAPANIDAIPLGDIQYPGHLTRSVVRRLSSPPPASGSGAQPASPFRPAFANQLVGSSSSIRTEQPAGTGFARLASPDDFMDDADLDAAIGLF
ncbi:hypothetical protein Q8F55_000147 [Vanrija albida]|uniref:Uncharacterized protein n=1 Tax=Vanrija albida TaxID=181172 RepID=A0ABR3QD23_9TREE